MFVTNLDHKTWDECCARDEIAPTYAADATCLTFRVLISRPVKNRRGR